MIVMSAIQKPLELKGLLCGGITFGTAYCLLFLSHPAWMAVSFDVFQPVFRQLILNIGISQIIVTNIALVACLILFFQSRDKFWLIAVAMLVISIPVTMYLLMPTNIYFLEATAPEISPNAIEKLKDWGDYQNIRFIADGLVLATMRKPVIWRQQSQRN